MRTLSLILAATAVAACNAAGIRHDNDGNIVVEPSDGTTIFMDASLEGGKTTIKQISAKFDLADEARAALTQNVADSIAAAERNLDDTVEGIRSDMDQKGSEIDDQLAATTNTLTKNLADGLTNTKAYADNKIDSVVTPAVNKIAQDLTALETKIKQDIDNDIKKELESIKKGLVGTNSAMPAADCAAINVARPGSMDGIYYIDSKYQSAAVRVWCATVSGKFVSRGGDCKSKAAACASCQDNHFENSAEKRWIDPDANANDPGNAKEENCEPDLMLKLVTTDSNIAEWDSSFWSSSSKMAADKAGDADWKGHKGDIKASGYYTAIGSKIQIIALSGSTEIGKAVYNIRSQYRSKSLKWLLHDQGSSNLNFATKDNGASTSGRPIYSKYMYQRGGNWGQRPYDMFLDTTGNLIARQRNYGGSQNSWSRLSSSDRSGWKGCHVYTGIGGDHYCNGWRIQYEASPIIGYCSTYNRYGKNHKNNKGGPTPNSHCGGNKRQSDIDFAILKIR